MPRSRRSRPNNGGAKERYARRRMFVGEPLETIEAEDWRSDLLED